jgi:uncharacterized protein
VSATTGHRVHDHSPAPRPAPEQPPVPAPPAGPLRRLVRLPFVALIRVYQLVISPWTAPSCRYYPSCSQYALIAIERHGLLRGGWLALRRLGRCHPWTPGGVDHVPPARGRAAAAADPSTTSRGA